MSHLLLLILSVIVGIMVVVQGGLNARLGVLISNSMLATSSALLTSASLTVLVAIITVRHFPSMAEVKEVPAYLWFTGGILSFIAVTLFYYIIPRVGISTAVTFGLAGQICFAAIAGHYGWFGLPVEPVSIKKLIGMLVLVAGVILIKY
ncbi:MAG: DMT family transporter [Cyclobacteriaceae bacterium]